MSTLNENILKVKETFEDIAAAIEEKGVDVGECESPTTYAAKIRSITGTGGGLDPNKLYVEAYDAGLSEPTVEASATDDGGIMLTFGLRRGSDGQTGPTGPAGKDGAPGADGKDGKDGKDGADGMDGSVYEYVYFRGTSKEHKPGKPASGVGNNTDDYVPTEKNTVSINGNSIVLKWSDKAQGVDETYKFEWRSERKKSDTNTWGDFTDPILWAKYGEKGKDGDGVQYIFAVTEKNSAPDNPTPIDWETNSEYQNNEAEEYIPSGWSDDPIEVDSTNKYCWTSVRKYRNGKWGRYSEPTLWTKWVESSGTVTADVIVIDMDPDFAMVNSDDNSAETTIQAFRGDDPIVIQDVTCDSGDYKCTVTPSNGNKTWKVVVSEIKNSVSIKVNIKLSDTSIRTKTFSIYHTKNDSETVSVDFGDDNILVPCSDGSNPDEGFFNNLEIPVMMRVAGQLVKATSITPDKNPESFEMTSAGNIKVKSFPGSAQKTSVKFTVSGGTNTAVGYVNFTKFNTAGGTIAMYTLNVAANDIVCDTRGDSNKYEVYTGATAVKDNVIKVSVNHYSSDSGNTVMSVSELPSTYAVFYANDPQDWAENANSTLGEYHKITDAGIKIGQDINPDKCVSFQLREWVGSGTPWSNMADGNYIVWDTENILVDIIRDIASYQFVVTPNKIHRNVNGEITVPENKEITVGLSKNKAGDGEIKYESLSVIPVGYDIYCEKDNNGSPEKFGEEHEDNTLPVKIDVSDVTNSIVLTLVVNENSKDDGQVVLSETIEITSDVPGESAYIGYITDPMCTVSCDANGIPTPGQIYDTEFKVTNGTVTNVSIPTGSGYQAEFKNGKVYFSNFTQELPEVTKLTLTATCTYSDGLSGTEEAGYTIVKLKVADASTILDFSNDNVVVPCDENGIPYVDSVSTFVAMLHGDDTLTLESSDVELGSPDSEGYYKITLNGIKNLPFTDGVYNKELTFKGTSESGESWTRKGQLILTKVMGGESGEIWDLVLTTDSPKYDNATDKFDDDYIEGWVNIWGSDNWRVASYDELSGAERYIVYKTNEPTSTYAPMQKSDFVDDHFRLYINPGFSGKTYVDIDRSSGVKIALAKLVEGQYVPIQEEIMRASYDGRDFGKFELMLSDEIISRHTDGDGNVTVTPTVVKINGIYEYSGMTREQYKGGETHNQHISGLDIYYGIDDAYNGETTVQKWMTELPDTGNDGYASNDTINVVNATSHVNVYLVAHYKEGDNPEELRIIDNKLIRVIPTADGTKGDKGDKGDAGTFSEAEKNALLEQAANNFKNAYYSKEDINALQAALEAAIASGDNAAIAKASSALNTANQVNEAIKSLESKFIKDSDGNTKLDPSVLNEADIWAISTAALGNEIPDTEGELHEDSIFAKNIVSLIGRFGTIKTDQLVGDDISGKTVQSADITASGLINKGKGWKLESNGKGHLANGSISWDEYGVVTLGPNVKFTWTDENKPTVDSDTGGTVVSLQIADDGENEIGNPYSDYLYYGEVLYNGSKSVHMWRYYTEPETFGNDTDYQVVLTNDRNPVAGEEVYLAGYILTSDDFTDTRKISPWDEYDGGSRGGAPTIDSVKTGTETTESGLTEADVIGIIKNTEISGSQITAPKIAADGINANYITTGILSAERLNINEIAAEVARVGDLSVKKLDTIPSGNYYSGKITIQDNDFYAYKKDGGNPVINISSDSNSNAFIEHNYIPKAIDFSVNQVDVTVPPISLKVSEEGEELYANGYTTVKLTSFKTSFLYKNRWGYWYAPVSYPSGTADFTAMLEGTEDNTDIKPDYLDICCYYVFAKQGVSIPFSTFKPVANNEYAKVGEDDTETYITEINTCGLYFYDGSFKNVGLGEMPLQDSTSYDVYLFISTDIRVTNPNEEGTWADWNLDLTFRRYLNSDTPYYFIKGKIEPKTESFVGITPKGFQHLVNYDQHITSSGSRILMRSGKWMFGIDAEGPFISDGTTTYNFDLSKMKARPSNSYYRYEY